MKTTTMTVVLASSSATLPVRGTSLIAFARGPKRKLLHPSVPFSSLSSSFSSLPPRFCSRSLSRSAIRCATGVEQQQNSSSSASESGSGLESAQLRAATAAAAAAGGGAAAVVEVGTTEEGEEGASIAAGGGGGRERGLEEGEEGGLGSKENFVEKTKGVWENLKEQHVIYRRERDQWGLGFNPLFTVYEDAEGKPYRVDVDEKEIVGRCGIKEQEWNEFQSQQEEEDEEVDSMRALAEKRMEMARAHARDIELGLVTPSPLSVLYKYERESKKKSSSGDSPSSILPPWANSDARSSVAVMQFLTLLIALAAVGGLFTGIKRLLSWKKNKKANEDDPKFVKNRQLMQERKLKAQRSRGAQAAEEDRGREEAVEEGNGLRSPPQQPQEQVEGRSNGVVNGTITLGKKEKKTREEEEGEDNDNAKAVFGEIVQAGGLEHPGPNGGGLNDEEFRTKVAQIRAMARKARLQEQENAEVRSRSAEERNILLDQDRQEEHPADEDEGEDGDEEEGERGQEEEVKRRLNVPNARGGIKPRIILSVEEARARIAAKRIARSIGASSSSPPFSGTVEAGKSALKNGAAKSNVNFEKVKKPPPVFRGPSSPSSSGAGTAANDVVESENISPSGSKKDNEEAVNDLDSNNLGAPRPGLTSSASVGATEADVDVSSRAAAEGSLNESAEIAESHRDRSSPHEEGEVGGGRSIEGQEKSQVEEEMEWMRDDVLREIVFKVQANEEAGRESFHNLNSEQETLFFKGLERKFEREGEEVKKWIKDRVENIDYGLDGIGLDDPPEAYQMKWKDGADAKSMKSSFREKFNEDRDRILKEKRGHASSSSSMSSPNLEATSSSSSADEFEEDLPFLSSSSPSSPSASPSPPSASSSSAATVLHPPSPPPASPMPPTTTINEDEIPRDGSRPETTAPSESKSQTIISSSPRAGKSQTSAADTRRTETDQSEGPVKENWDHTKRWAKDLERKYANETDPATRALMREIGQDLDRWITEDEINEASRLLDKGVEGEEEYAKMHYERIKAKIQYQREQFGRDAMLNKYSEYKDDVEEDIELWWLGLPYVVCVGLRATVDGEAQTGLYSVDVGGALEGVRGLPNVAYHTVAFQDRGDAQNFCRLVNSQPEKVGAEGGDPVPFDPKDLYRDAKAEGYKVTVIKKGQLEFSVDSSFEEVEHRIVELSSSIYFTEMMKDRVIDMNTIVEEGLGFGRKPQ